MTYSQCAAREEHPQKPEETVSPEAVDRQLIKQMGGWSDNAVDCAIFVFQLWII